MVDAAINASELLAGKADRCQSDVVQIDKALVYTSARHIRDLAREVKALRAKNQRLAAALAGQSKVAYQRGYQQGVSDAVDEK